MTLAILIAVVVVFLTIGIAMLVSGLRGRVLDGHPVCRRCRFDLVGSVPGLAKCPECGSPLDASKSIAIGNRSRRPLIAGIGAAVILLSIGGGGTLIALQLGAAGLAKFLPARVLVLVCQFVDGGSEASRVAINELAVRFVAKELSTSTVHDLARVGLEMQADLTKPWVGAWGDFIFQSQADGTLSQADWLRYARQALTTFTLSANSRVVASDDVLVSISSGFGSRVGTQRDLFAKLSNWRVRFADQTVLVPGGSAGITLGGGGYGSVGMTVKGPAQSGTYPLSVEVDISVGSRLSSISYQTTQTLTLATPVTVLLAGTSLIERLDDPARDEAMRSALRIGEATITAGPTSTTLPQMQFGLYAQSIPVPLAVNVYIVLPSMPDKRWLARTATIPAGANGGYVGGQTLPNDFPIDQLAGGPTTLDFVLVPSEKAAKGLLNATQIWGREIVIRGVPVQVIKPSPTPPAKPTP